MFIALHFGLICFYLGLECQDKRLVPIAGICAVRCKRVILCSKATMPQVHHKINIFHISLNKLHYTILMFNAVDKSFNMLYMFFGSTDGSSFNSVVIHFLYLPLTSVTFCNIKLQSKALTSTLN